MPASFIHRLQFFRQPNTGKMGAGVSPREAITTLGARAKMESQSQQSLAGNEVNTDKIVFEVRWTPSYDNIRTGDICVFNGVDFIVDSLGVRLISAQDVVMITLTKGIQSNSQYDYDGIVDNN